MNTIDAVILTLLNTIACFAFPKLLSVIMAGKNKRTAPDSRSWVEPSHSQAQPSRFQAQPGNALKQAPAPIFTSLLAIRMQASALCAISRRLDAES
jgi:hypothetical protein